MLRFSTAALAVTVVSLIHYGNSASESCGGVSGWYLGDAYLFYPLDSTSDTFNNQQTNCQSLITGKTDLAIVDNNNINFVANSFSSWFSTNSQAWVRLQRDGTGSSPDQGWQWAGSSSPAFNSSSWASGQPDGSGDYGAFSSSGSGVSYLVSKSSSATIGALCGIKSESFVVFISESDSCSSYRL
jgi:hypothetical protein